MWVVLWIRVPFTFLFITVPYYLGTYKVTHRLENFSYGTARSTAKPDAEEQRPSHLQQQFRATDAVSGFLLELKLTYHTIHTT